MTVHLVGAGPGDPDLLTVRAARLLAEADVVVHDRLVSRGVLDLVGQGAELVDVGKRVGSHRWSQAAINELLGALGHAHTCVVRLKGGDPFVFGRGGEEALALRAAGVDVSVVPGITSAVAGPAAAGIPVTDRRCSSGFTVVTAHQDPHTDRALDWDALARLGTTLVVLMGAAHAGAVAERLQRGGMDPATPVAVVTAATCDDQQTTRTRLDALASLAVRAPAVIVVGAVAAMDVTETDLWSQLTPVLDEGVPA